MLVLTHLVPCHRARVLTHPAVLTRDLGESDESSTNTLYHLSTHLSAHPLLIGLKHPVAFVLALSLSLSLLLDSTLTLNGIAPAE